MRNIVGSRYDIKNILFNDELYFNIQLIGENEVIVSIILSKNNMNVIMPIIIKVNENYSLPTITFTSFTTNQTYVNSFIPLDITHYSFDNSNNKVYKNQVNRVFMSDYSKQYKNFRYDGNCYEVPISINL